jgi:predicted ATP-dependent endonuclease of OLD family
MLRSLTIKNFRGFRELKIEPLARVNLIAGKNDVGKTGLLEALYLLFANADQFSHFPSAFRSSQERMSGEPNAQEQKDNLASFWRWLPHRNDSIGQIQIIADADEVQLDKECTQLPIHDLVFHYQTNGSEVVTRTATSPFGSGTTKGLLPLKVYSTRHPQPTEDAELFNSLVLKKKKQKLIEALKKVEPRLVDLQYLKVGSEPLVYVDLGLKELIPLTQLGQGVTRLFRFLSEMLVEEAKIVLIDEIENGIHHSVLSDVWKGLAMIALEEKLQVFATTHSWECIKAAHKVFASGDPNEFRLHRLEEIKGEIKAVTYDEETIDAALRFEMEVR